MENGRIIEFVEGETYRLPTEAEWEWTVDANGDFGEERGGSWNDEARNCRVSSRNLVLRRAPIGSNFGFRLAMSVK